MFSGCIVKIHCWNGRDVESSLKYPHITKTYRTVFEKWQMKQGVPMVIVENDTREIKVVEVFDLVWRNRARLVSRNLIKRPFWENSVVVTAVFLIHLLTSTCLAFGIAPTVSWVSNISFLLAATTEATLCFGLSYGKNLMKNPSNGASNSKTSSESMFFLEFQASSVVCLGFTCGMLDGFKLEVVMFAQTLLNQPS